MVPSLITVPGHLFKELAVVAFILPFSGGTVIKNPPANAGDTRDTRSILGSRRSPGGGNSNPFQYSCLEKSHGPRRLVGYSPWSHKELDMTEHTCAHITKAET